MNRVLLNLDRYTISLSLLCLGLCVLVLAKNFDKPSVQRAGQAAWLWRIIFFKYANGSFIVFGSAVIGAHLLTPIQESWLGCFLAMSKSWELFLNQDVEKLKTEIKNAIGDTQIFFRPQNQSTEQKPSTETKS